MFNLNFVDDWIRTADLWSCKQPLYLKRNIFNFLVWTKVGATLKLVYCCKHLLIPSFLDDLLLLSFFLSLLKEQRLKNL